MSGSGPHLAISIVIPVYREFNSINSCLHHLARMRDIQAAEVIVVDGDRGTTLERIFGEYPFSLKRIISPQGRGIQLNRGAAESQGSFLLFLHADTILPRSGLNLVRRALENRLAGSFDLQVDTKHYGIKLIRLFASVRSRMTRIPYGDQAMFIKRETFRSIGGFEEIPIMEDVAFMQNLKSRKIQITILREAVHTSDRRWRKEGVLRTTLRNWYIYMRYLTGTPSWKLLSMYPPNEPENSD